MNQHKKNTAAQIEQPSVTVTYNDPASKHRASSFAETFQLPCSSLQKCDSQLALNFSQVLVELIDIPQKMQLSVDFIHGSLGHRKKYGGGKGQTIAKAIGLKQGKAAPYVLDATAGLGKDSYVFACLGCRVTLVERSPIVAELVRDAINRASLNAEFAEILQQGFELIQDDALQYLGKLDETGKPDVIYPDVIYPDVIYLDPMYPEKKKSASVKKNMQMLQTLLGHDQDTGKVLDLALHHARQRVVVKRPKGAPVIKAERAPTLAYESKSTRYDVYINTQK